jgi:hypothetical protein
MTRLIAAVPALAVIGGLMVAPSGASAASGARVILECEGAGGPVDVRACLPQSRLEISREGEKSAYAADDLAALAEPSDGRLSLTMPYNFSVKVQNTGTDVTLSLTIEAPNGATVHTGEAKRFEWVQFHHCGPQVNPTCRDYSTPTN